MHLLARTTLCVMLSATVVACSREGAPVPAPAAPAASGAPPAATPAAGTADVDPCALLDTQVVRRAVPDAGAAQRDRSDDGYGMRTCAWGTGPSAVVLQAFDVPAGAAEGEIRTRSFALVDPKSPKAPTAVRLEAFPGIGDAAIAFVERVDAARGTRAAGAAVVVQVGFRAVVVRAPALAGLERDEALSRLRLLAQDAATRLAR